MQGSRVAEKFESRLEVGTRLVENDPNIQKESEEFDQETPGP